MLHNSISTGIMHLVLDSYVLIIGCLLLLLQI